MLKSLQTNKSIDGKDGYRTIKKKKRGKIMKKNAEAAIGRA